MKTINQNASFGRKKSLYNLTLSTCLITGLMAMPVISNAEISPQNGIIEQARQDIVAAQAEIADAELVIARAQITKAKAKIAASEALIDSQAAATTLTPAPVIAVETDTLENILPNTPPVPSLASVPSALPVETQAPTDIIADVSADKASVRLAIAAVSIVPESIQAIPAAQTIAATQPANLIAKAPIPALIIPPIPRLNNQTFAANNKLPKTPLAKAATLETEPFLDSKKSLDVGKSLDIEKSAQILGGLIDIQRNVKTAPIDGCDKVQKGLNILGGFTVFTCEKLLPYLPITQHQTAYEEYQEAFLDKGWDVRIDNNSADTRSFFERVDENGCTTDVALSLWDDRSMNESKRERGDRNAHRQIVFQVNFNGDSCESYYPIVQSLEN